MSEPLPTTFRSKPKRARTKRGMETTKQPDEDHSPDDIVQLPAVDYPPIPKQYFCMFCFVLFCFVLFCYYMNGNTHYRCDLLL